MGITTGRRAWRKGLGGKHKQRKGPLRKVVEVLRHGEGMFDRDRVRLECGHETDTNAARARCSKCYEERIRGTKEALR